MLTSSDPSPTRTGVLAETLPEGSGENVVDGMQAESAAELGTSHLLPDLKGRTISSGIVTISAQVAKLLLNVLSITILARLLLPRDFGLIAMVATIIGMLRVLKDAGLSTATIQSKELTQSQVSNLFWINVALGGALACIGALLSPAIAWFYGDSRLVQIGVLL